MMIVSVVVLVQQDVLLKQSARVLLITKSTLMFVLIVVLVLEHVQLALLTHSSLNKIQINVHQMVFNVPERYLHKTPDQFNTDSGFSFLSLFNYCLKSLERSANLVCSGSHAILTVPIGPLRCLAIIISAIPFCSVSLL